MAFQFSITAIGSIILQSALNTLGSTAVAAFTAGSKIEMFAMQPLHSLGVAVATYTAQNYGARKLGRIKKEGVKSATIIATVCSIVGGAVVIALAEPLVSLFVGSGQNEVVLLAKEYLILHGALFIMLGLLYVYRNVLQGMGRSMLAFLGGVCELVMRSLVALALVPYLQFTAVSIASPAAWFGAMAWLMIAYFVTIKRITKKSDFVEDIE